MLLVRTRGHEIFSNLRTGNFSCRPVFPRSVVKDADLPVLMSHWHRDGWKTPLAIVFHFPVFSCWWESFDVIRVKVRTVVCRNLKLWLLVRDPGLAIREATIFFRWSQDLQRCPDCGTKIRWISLFPIGAFELAARVFFSAELRRGWNYGSISAAAAADPSCQCKIVSENTDQTDPRIICFLDDVLLCRLLPPPS